MTIWITWIIKWITVSFWEKTAWIIEKHAIFQTYYYVHHYGGNRNQREQFANHPWFQDAVDFCENWDQSSFDPDYDNEDLVFFVPMMKRIFRSVQDT